MLRFTKGGVDMLGLRFKPGVIYADDSGWLRVKTRGPVITRGVDQPTIRMTAVDRDGVARRTKVYAQLDYRTATTFPPVFGVQRLPVQVPGEQPKPRPRSNSQRALTAPRPKSALATAGSASTRSASARPRKAKSRSPQLKIAPRQETFLSEACYWLPLDMSNLRPLPRAIVEALSELPWAEASAVRRSTDDIIVEHDVPTGLDAAALAARVHHTEEGVRNALPLLIARGLVEQSPADRRLYRLRGWQCLHTRRRTTRRAIEHGGGRAVYATVRFSA